MYALIIDTWIEPTYLHNIGIDHSSFNLTSEIVGCQILGGQAQVLAVARPNWIPTEKKSSAVDNSQELPLVQKVQKPKKSETDVKAEQADWIKKYMAQQAEVFSLDLVNGFDIHVSYVFESTRSSNSIFSQHLILILTLAGPLPCTNILSGCAGGFR